MLPESIPFTQKNNSPVSTLNFSIKSHGLESLYLLLVFKIDTTCTLALLVLSCAFGSSFIGNLCCAASKN